MDSENKQTPAPLESNSKKGFLVALLAAIAAAFGFFFMNQNEATPGITAEPIAVEAIETPKVAEAAPSTKPAEIVNEPTPVDQPPKPTHKAKKTRNRTKVKEEVVPIIDASEPIKYNPADFRVVDFFENMAVSKSAMRPAKMTSPSANALVLPDAKGDYVFQLGVDLICEKDTRIEIFPNKEAAFTSNKPLYRHVFPTEHKGPWKKYIDLNSKPGLHYVILRESGGVRVLGKFILN